jgi:hypothetical protein
MRTFSDLSVVLMVMWLSLTLLPRVVSLLWRANMLSLPAIDTSFLLETSLSLELEFDLASIIISFCPL